MIKKFIALFLALIPMTLSAESTKELGERLVFRLWSDILQGDTSKIRGYTSDDFEATIPALNIRRSRSQEMQAITDNPLSFYKIRYLKAERTHNTLITTYFLQANVTVSSALITYSSTMQLSVWRKINGHWKWVAQQGTF